MKAPKNNTAKTVTALAATFIILFAAAVPASAQADKTTGDYLESIRNNKAALTAFFSLMPKGGDLHNHLTGSIYTETYIDYVVNNDYFINTATLEVAQAPGKVDGWVQFSTLQKQGLLDKYKQKLFQIWSVKDYNGVSYPSDKLFFETFPLFGVASSKTIDSGLVELKRRAKTEHVNYIETMTGVFDDAMKRSFNAADAGLLNAQKIRNENAVAMILDTLYNTMIDTLKMAAVTTDTSIAKLHFKLNMDDADFTLRYQLAFVRVVGPTSVFRKMVTAFEAVATDTSKLMGGVNILAPENNDISMRDYWLHMQMFKFLRAKAQYSKVKCSLHAGELVLGMVKPEDLTWHIYDAIHVANADRIGHGVDMPYEHDCYDLLKFMADNHRAIEINLYSNEFILKVQDDRHPITLYKQFKVPITISTDDAGVLRSNLIEQYVLLASRYKDITYKDIKQFVYNSIEYSFIPDASIKTRIKAQLDSQFKAFEKKIGEIGK